MSIETSFDVRQIAAELLNADNTMRYMTELVVNDKYVCDVEFSVLRVQNKYSGDETVFRQPTGLYRPSDATLH